jgi:LysM repeat protein
MIFLISWPVQLYSAVNFDPGNGQLLNGPANFSAFVQDATATIDPAVLNIQTATPQDDGSVIHTVADGQSLWGIALAYGVFIGDIQNLNGLDADNSVIQAGQNLMIFPPGSIETEIPAVTNQPADLTGTADSLITPTSTETPAPTLTATSSGFTIPDAVEKRMAKPGSLVFPAMAVLLIAAGFVLRKMIKSERG